MKKKIYVGLSAAILVLCLCACQFVPKGPQSSETTTPGQKAAEIYAQARASLDSAEAVTLDIVQTTTTLVEGSCFVDESEQVLSFAGLNTNAPMTRLETVVPYQDSEETQNSEDEEETAQYTELYANGTLYVELEDRAAFSGSLSQEEHARRYIPVVLLDAGLYEELTVETSETQTTVSFASPTAAEGWAMPEEAQLLDASGSALIGTDGNLQQMNYTITYQYGSAEITLAVESTPRAEAEQITVPEDVDRYAPLQYIDALQMMLYGRNLIKQADTASVSVTDVVTCQIAGVVRSQSTTMDMYDVDEDLMFKVTNNLQFIDSQNGDQSVKQEETYRDGKYVITVDDGLPTSQAGIKDDDIREYSQSTIAPVVPSPEYWEDVAVTDLDGVYLLEYTYSEDFGNSIQNAICLLFWEDASFLNKMASAYVNDEISGYLAIDKYTGLITAAGISFEGIHTIDGIEYALTMDTDQALETPSIGAYSEITDEQPEEAEPEQKAQPLFYHVTGENGQEMWLLGTIHVGDTRTGFLPQQIYDAFASSDALALEIDQEAFETQMAEDEKLQQQLYEAYYYSDGSTVEDHLDPQLYEQALKYIKASGNYTQNVPYMKVSMWESSIANFYLQLGHQLHTEQGVEARLTQLAKEQEMPIREVESSLFQIQMLNGWSDELQELMLEETLAYSPEEYWAETYALYELWCAGDEAALRKEINQEVDLSQLSEEELAEYNKYLPLEQEYNKTMLFDRNAGMLDVAIEYLESGDVVFYAVGLAHLLDNTNGLVYALELAGYTVEQVYYS